MAIRLVLADDHALVLEGIAQVLQLEKDFQILDRCTDGVQALSAVRSHRPDVLVLDLRMPKLDGIEVLRQIRKEQLPTAVVLLTGEIHDNEVLEALRLGVAGMVLKVMASRLLVQCIRKVHAGEHWVEKQSFNRALKKLLRTEEALEAHASSLSNREIDVVKLAARGMRNRAIGEKLCISDATVKIHLHHIYQKLRLSSRVELSLYARDQGLV